MKQMLTFLVVLVMLSACGGESTDGGACSSGFVSEYNEVARAANNASTKAQVEEAKRKAEDFKNRYATANCSAELNGRVTVINAKERMDQTISALELRALLLP